MSNRAPSCKLHAEGLTRSRHQLDLPERSALQTKLVGGRRAVPSCKVHEDWFNHKEATEVINQRVPFLEIPIEIFLGLAPLELFTRIEQLAKVHVIGRACKFEACPW